MPTKKAAVACFALFVFAGYYKAADFLQFVPVDLTLLFAAATTAFCAFEAWRRRHLVSCIGPMLAVFLAMAMGLHWPEDLGAYATQKELRLFSLTALSAFAPLLLLREDAQRRVFVYAVSLLALVMAALAAIEAARFGLSARNSVFNTNPILLARASGFAGLLLCLLYWQGRLSLWIFAPAAAVALLGLLVSGTKAPLLGLLLTGFAMVPLALMDGATRTRVWATLIVGLAGLTGVLAYLASARIHVGRRILGLLSGDWGASGGSRLALWQETLDLIPESPAGIGWGRFSEWIQVFHYENLLRHPHNIVLEITVEAGWLAGAAFLALVALTTSRSILAVYRGATMPSGHGAVGELVVPVALIYWFICASFSGDVNDNRPLWAMLGMAVAAHANRRIIESSHVDSELEVPDTGSGRPGP
jgi:O-antigen ligase